MRSFVPESLIGTTEFRNVDVKDVFLRNARFQLRLISIMAKRGFLEDHDRQRMIDLKMRLEEHAEDDACTARLPLLVGDIEHDDALDDGVKISFDAEQFENAIADATFKSTLDEIYALFGKAGFEDEVCPMPKIASNDDAV